MLGKKRQTTNIELDTTVKAPPGDVMAYISEPDSGIVKGLHPYV